MAAIEVNTSNQMPSSEGHEDGPDLRSQVPLLTLRIVPSVADVIVQWMSDV
jgi:hypothetical protein